MLTELFWAIRSTQFEFLMLFYFEPLNPEAEYMYRLRKDIIPLILQPGYTPDGWLGILVGTRLYFDLSSPVTFESELKKLTIEIGDRGRLASPFLRHLSSMSTPSPRSVSHSPDLMERQQGLTLLLFLCSFYGTPGG